MIINIKTCPYDDFGKFLLKQTDSIKRNLGDNDKITLVCKVGKKRKMLQGRSQWEDWYCKDTAQRHSDLYFVPNDLEKAQSIFSLMLKLY